MGFSEDYMEDIDDVFFDDEELAGEHTIDGVALTAIVRNTTFVSTTEDLRVSRRTVNPKENSVNTSACIVFIRKRDAERKFRSGGMINFDGKKMFVHDVKEIPGMIRIVMGANGM